MRLIRGLHNLQSCTQAEGHPFPQGCVATIGNFDGVHRGHQAIIEQVRQKALALGVPSVAMVFEPQPQEFFAGADAPPRLMRFREKLTALWQYGIDTVVCLQFTPRLRKLSAKEFVERVLIDGLQVRHLVVGDDFRFGCDRGGDFLLLQQQGAAAGFSVENTETVLIAGERISSTRVRKALAENRLADAEELLGRPYAIEGRVLHGRELGRKLDARTANIGLGHKNPALRGVYVVQVGRAGDGEGGGESCSFGAANIGYRPTVDGVDPLLEVHLLDFEAELYGERLRATFLHQLRDEVRFDGVEALKKQIHQDFADARAWLASHPPRPTNRDR
ncbi:bifunctional riboflavin kinase/FAD synthetase [Hydrocarboniclastica marina]|uniref:Riboflavin biosynthesis protein n=1 Tax=Hydrocarboniclastica marina TaxID=2259620 RepID=A0A4V1D8G4_9ALTE|nr:bifunctional riboflavin kinase/FAD synthetase [Hydrocarboniclastica marina]MAL99485.1 bifunctional riboflavin kinase/FMN adenylyltransferase [Alteromonadaceae bacterium]QCF25100.1 bifunctional riboflavin kinase/FAD synthetase [Hydrocarboniclastica marina]|tara:strand:- start:1024 stop:2022 length:999 start_codon:yes stop_codon:yes gene_type:complete